MGLLMTSEIKPATRKDYFTEKEGRIFAGTHLIVDIWDAEHLSDLTLMEETLKQAVTVSGATLLHIHLHHFNEHGGISGVAVLAESHITLHSWPELGYCAMDVFMCGAAQPHKAIDVFKQAFNTDNVLTTEHQRGLIK